MEKTEDINLKKLTTLQFINFALGFFGLQFAWQLEIILSGPVTESLGASPFIFGLIWLAGPITGILIQPIIGSLSDRTVTRFGRRRPYLLAGAIFGSLALWIFPNSGSIVDFINNYFKLNLPSYSGLLFAAAMIWIIDACVNMSQGPYRALVPDKVPLEQHSIANAYISLAIGLGSVVAAGTPPFLKWAFDYEMSIPSRFLMGALTFSLAMIWTCIMVKEKNLEVVRPSKNVFPEKPKGFFANFKDFFSSSPEIKKICMMQFFTWIGLMCLMIFFTQYSVHTVFKVPDLTLVSETVKQSFESTALKGTNFASICFTFFNLICFLFSVPIGLLSSKYGKKKIHTIALSIIVFTFLGMAFIHDKRFVLALMGIAGIGWASLLSIPFAMLSKHIKAGSEGISMGIFNIFIASSQIITCTLIAWFVSKCSFMSTSGINYHWEYVFILGAICLLMAICALCTVRD